MTIAEAVSEARSSFAEGLLGLGFSAETPTRFVGEVDWQSVSTSGSTTVQVLLTEAFPFSPPLVHAVDFDAEISWHLNADGGMCLWDQSQSNSDLPWANAQKLIARAAAWLVAAADGWPDDPPDLDLERYLMPESGLLVYDDQILDECIDQPVKVSSNSVTR